MPTPEPVEDVRQIAHIAYGFKASKALMAALELGLFDELAIAARSAEELSASTRVPLNRIEVLLSVLAALGLLTQGGSGGYSNSSATDDYLVRGKRTYLGEYFLGQTDALIYPAYSHLGMLLREGATPARWGNYGALMEDPQEARRFSDAQHAGSVGPANLLAKRLDLTARTALLDVGGGSGAFTLALLSRNPALRATILDYPAALASARENMLAAGLGTRVEFLPGDAETVEWPIDHDTVLMSYLLSAVDAESIPRLLQRAGQALPPGGLLIVHDFFVNEDRSGPLDAALWFLTCMFNAPQGRLLTPGFIHSEMQRAGFSGASDAEIIPGLTRALVGRKLVE